MDKLELERIRWEAIRYAEDRGIARDEKSLNAIIGSFTRRAFLDAIEPFVRMKVRIHALLPLKSITIDTTNQLPARVEYNISPDTQAVLDQIDKLIADEARRYGSHGPL